MVKYIVVVTSIVIIVIQSNEMQTIYNQHNKDASVLYATKAMPLHTCNFVVECIQFQHMCEAVKAALTITQDNIELVSGHYLHGIPTSNTKRSKQKI